MYGVKNMKNDLLSAKYLLNLDSEELEIITIGSAGGFCGDFTFPSVKALDCNCSNTLKVTVSSCSGGHSGVNIHCYRANATKLLARILAIATMQCGKISCV